MKKLIAIIGLMFMGNNLYSDELRPQFRVWKSSFIGSGVFTNTLITTSSIIFHTVVGSPTLNNGNNSYFAIHQSSGDIFTSDSSTRAFVPLDMSVSGIGIGYDVRISSHVYFTKQGGAVVSYLWDWYGARPRFPTPHDPN